MKTIGFVQGYELGKAPLLTTKLSTKLSKRELGGLRSAKILLYSVDFCRIGDIRLLETGTRIAQVLADVPSRAGGAGLYRHLPIPCTGAADSEENCNSNFAHCCKQLLKPW